MITVKSVRNFVTVNGFIGILAACQAMFLVDPHWASLFLWLVIRNFVVTYTIDYTTSVGQQDVVIHGNKEPYVLQAAALETITVFCLPVVSGYEGQWIRTLICFIPVSFAFEVLFDFFHYWIHRSMHAVHYSWHKTHHEYVHLKPILAFHQNVFDLALSNSIPFILTERLISSIYPLSIVERSLIMTYKIYLEVAGHSAHSSGRTSCFPQCIWLPRALGIELYADDHAAHHSMPFCNFAKRFSLWDKVFGTWERKG
jgi:sterol desaturase/sphingolipid hydroxylase (fatty acid hydroxylase superfamily)